MTTEILIRRQVATDIPSRFFLGGDGISVSIPSPKYVAKGATEIPSPFRRHPI